jgi:hypothetical protein
MERDESSGFVFREGFFSRIDGNWCTGFFLGAPMVDLDLWIFWVWVRTMALRSGMGINGMLED